MHQKLPVSVARAATWCTCVLITLDAMALFGATHTAIAIGPLAAASLLIAIPAGLHIVYTRWRPDPFVGPISGGLAAICWAGLVSGVSALAALRYGAPLIDAWLASADRHLGLDTPPFVAWVARHDSIARLLDIAYKSTVPLIFTSVVLLGLMRREERIWELCFVFAGTSASCAFISAIIPASQAFVYYDTPREISDLLPAGAGRFAMPVFDAYYSRALDTVNVHDLNGVVSFPSFHTAMALMTAYALRRIRFLSILAWMWCGLILVSTIPIGGHYAVDILAGAALWAAFTLPIRHESSGPTPR